jgi:hypothetical protein
MLEIMAVNSENHIKCINTLCGQTADIFKVKAVIYVVTTVHKEFNIITIYSRKKETRPLNGNSMLLVQIL